MIKISPLWQIRNQTDDVISNQTLNETQSTDTYTSIWHHQSRTTLHSLCRTLWPQTVENIKVTGILLGIQPGYDDGRQTNTRGRCNKGVKRDHGYLGDGYKVIESIRICTQFKDLKKQFFSASSCVSSASHANKLFSLKLCSSFPFFASPSWRCRGLFSLTLHWQPFTLRSDQRKTPDETPEDEVWAVAADVSAVFTAHSFQPGQPWGPDLGSHPT